MIRREEAGLDVDELSDVIGENVRRLRAARGWSQDALAGEAELSKGTVVAIEQQRSNPSVATLCALSEALGVGLATLLEAPSGPFVKLRRAEDAVALWRTSAGSHAELLLGTDPPGALELWRWELVPGEAFEGSPHPRGTTETLHLHDGALDVRVGDRQARLDEGDVLVFEGHEPHRYACHGETTARFSMWIVVGDAGDMPPPFTHGAPTDRAR